MTERPRYHGPQNLGQLWELSEDAQEIWEAYQELSDYVDELQLAIHEDKAQDDSWAEAW